uniref:Rap-GAP domain-containing protein n=1 Tax=Oncorhynchus tshawytscha TaxID=74940 RepID=A0AAZ3RDK0_ONCTS
MFTRRGHGDVKKSTQKVLDPKKDVLTRLKHLRSLLEKADCISELKTFFESNCSQIYFIFYENFITLESNLKQKGNKSQREELDSILFIFEKILQLLPEKIYSRWQFHSIGSILKKLLHTGNSFKIRCEGIRLFLLWLQALQNNCAEEQFLIFACLVPGFPAVPSTRGPCTLDTIIYNPFSNPSDGETPQPKVVPEEITPLVPAVPGEKLADDQTCYILQTLLKFMVVQVSLEWRNKDNQDTGFRFLFSLFKKYYLPHLFPSFTKLTNLYKPLLDLPHHRPKPLYVPVTRNNESTFCTRDQYLAPRVAFITWLVTFFLDKKYISTPSAKNGTNEVIPKLIQRDKDRGGSEEPHGPTEPEKSHSNSSTLSDRRPSDSSLCSIDEEHRSVYDMVHGILLSTRDNINFVNEVFHQAFLLPSCETSATRKVIKVYRKWILQEKPGFMTEPEKSRQAEVEENPEQLLITETDNTHTPVMSITQTNTHTNTNSTTSQWTHTRGCLTEEQNRDIKAGIQPTLQCVFLTNSANVFLLEPCQDVPKLLDNQVEVCKGVLSIYRHMIMEHAMNTQTWQQMLQVLLRITEAVMKRPQENQRKDPFAESLAAILFRTIIVAWVRANLCVFISRELWDELLSVLSSLTGWEELVTEWASIMDSLTAVLARSVYGLDMSNLPLDKLSEQKEKKQRGRGVVQDSQKAAAVARSFSLSWRNQGDQQGVQEPMRFRSATTSGAPGVEKARNNVRQKATGEHTHYYNEVTFCQCQMWLKYRSVESLYDTLVFDRFATLPPLSSCPCAPSSSAVSSLSPYLVLGPECTLSPHSAPLSQHQHPPASPALLVHPECRECPQLLEDTMHQSVLHMPQDLDSSECLTDDVSIIAGGSLTGWHADSAFVLWRRILGILGDVNSIRCPRIHAKVFSYLYDLWHKLAKIRDNLGISVDNQSSPPRPVFIPPLRMLASWLFKATMLPSEFKMGKLQAYKLICEMMTKNQDVLPNSDFLVHLYQVMHKGFTSEDQDVLNTVIRSCSPRFFYLGLPGFTMLVGDFITAAARILSHDTAPRIDAQTVLGSLVCFPNLYLQIPLLQTVPGTDNIVIGNEDIKDYLVNILLKTARNEPCEAARCIAVCSLGLWVCEELMQNHIHHQVKDAINVLGVTLKFGNKAVAHVACDLFQLLISHWEHLQRLERSLPKKIIEIFVATIAFLLPSAEHSAVEADKKVRGNSKGPFFPIEVGSAFAQESCSIWVLFVSNSPALSLFFSLQPSLSVPTSLPPSSPSLAVLLIIFKRRNMELIPLTARMIMTHLVNHLGHHPLSGGPALLHSLVSENHDNPFVESSELSSEVFKSPNLQLFVFNDSTLVSYLQVPSEPSGPGEPYDNSSQVRVIVRDISGKYSWDGGVLYHPSNHSTTKPTSPGTSDPYNHSTTKPTSPGTSDPYNHSTTKPTSPGTSERSNPPGWDSQSGCDEEEVDGLDQLLEDLGYSSPECLPQPRLRLNQPAPSPCGMNLEQEGAIMEAILRQMQQEEEQVKRWNADVSVKATGQREPTHQEPKALFYFCRLLLNDLGMNSWDHRKSFHLLKKNSKLLRELKNLDSRHCRETHKIAVFYIGEGQEDKCSILSNSAGSKTYEDFVSGLGWEVDLATHCGFMGGLQRNGSTGHTAPYYATSTVEVILHVSTRMPSNSDDCLTKKLRHLGNDEVHIVWSEHSRDYRRGIIPTDFGDVLIIVYPMKNHTFFIQIMKKPQVPFFGPLFNGAIVTGTLLPSLVRATCINASRAVKSRLTLYQSFYEERALYLEAIVQNHREVMTFEDFASQVFSPSTSYYPMSGTGQNPTLLLHFLLYSTAAHLLALLFRPLHLYVLVLVSSHPHSDEYQRQQGQALSTLSEQQHQRLYRGSAT